MENDEQEVLEEVVVDEVEETTDDVEETNEPITLTQAELDAKLEEVIKNTRKDQDKRWKERMSGLDDKPKVEKKLEGNEALLERMDRQELIFGGIKVPEDQDEILAYAKLKDVSIQEAMESNYAKSVQAERKRSEEQREATKAPSNRTSGGKVDEVSKWVAKYKKDGTLPDNPVLVTEVLKAIK